MLGQWSRGKMMTTERANLVISIAQRTRCARTKAFLTGVEPHDRDQDQRMPSSIRGDKQARTRWVTARGLRYGRRRCPNRPQARNCQHVMEPGFELQPPTQSVVPGVSAPHAAITDLFVGSRSRGPF